MTLCTAVAKGSSNRMQVPPSRPSITQADVDAGQVPELLQTLGMPTKGVVVSGVGRDGSWQRSFENSRS